jgi:hypothetical protein
MDDAPLPIIRFGHSGGAGGVALANSERRIESEIQCGLDAPCACGGLDASDRVVMMTHEEYDQAMAELDPPYEQRQRLKEQREQEKLRGRERNLTDAEMARWREHLAGLVPAERDYMLRLLPELIAQMREEIST